MRAVCRYTICEPDADARTDAKANADAFSDADAYTDADTDVPYANAYADTDPNACNAGCGLWGFTGNGGNFGLPAGIDTPMIARTGVGSLKRSFTLRSS